MPVAWFIAPDRRVALNGHPSRWCAINEYDNIIRQDGGNWTGEECLGGRYVCKVRASVTTLQTIAADPTIRRLPKSSLGDSLSNLTTAQKRNLRDWIEECGYSRAEWQADLGTDLGAFTLRDVLRFVLKRRFQPRYLAATDAITLDGTQETPLPVEFLDSAVADV